MYENKTYEKILNEKMQNLPANLDKREGSVIYNALAPNSIEAAMLYDALETVLSETFADTASRSYLIKRCAERGTTPLPATSAVGIGVFNKNVETGKRFSCEQFNWVVTEKIAEGKFYLSCETAGEEPNSIYGALIPIDYIDGLTSAMLTEIAINGEDEESTEDLRQRYINTFKSQSYGFNRSQYIEVVQALPGVGGCKPYRAWAGPGTVKLVITDSSYSVPSQELVNVVQTTIDPTANSGEGLGVAPIDHEVTVVAAEGTVINLETSLTFAAGLSIRDCEAAIEKVLDEYYLALNKTWGDEENLIVRISQIESLILGVDGIIDINGTKINSAAANLMLGANAVAVRGALRA